LKTKTLLRNYYVFFRDFFKDLLDDRLGYYASSLSWNTIFSIIPLLVILLYVFTTLPLFQDTYDKVQELIFANLMPTQSKEIMENINTFIANSDKLGMVGAFYVTFAAIMFFKNYDYIVNDIFELPSRGILESIKTYLILIILLPLMMGASFYLSSFIQSYLDKNTITSMIHLYSILPSWAIFLHGLRFCYLLDKNEEIEEI